MTLRSLLPFSIFLVAACSTTKAPERRPVPVRSDAAATALSPEERRKRGEVFDIGDTFANVKGIMGSPDDVRETEKGEIWNYGFSMVDFRNGRVTGWYDVGGKLAARGVKESQEDEKKRLAALRESSLIRPHGMASAIVHSPARSAGESNINFEQVNAYTRQDGTYVAEHRRTRRDSSSTNNWSSSGNHNSFTGRRGYH